MAKRKTNKVAKVELVAKRKSYRSEVDGVRRPYFVCEVNMDAAADMLPLFVCVSPWGGDDLRRLQKSCAGAARAVQATGQAGIVLRPTARGGGSRSMNYGEVDVLAAIDDACRKYPIDRDRIYVFGTSMGGAATWYLASHYPDVFAGAAPACGYCDYRLWNMAGGRTYHMYEWEKASWKARCAAFLVENLEHTPVCIQHGGRDRTTGGGVTVLHSRRMAQALKERGFDYIYEEVPKMGHGGGLTPERAEWLLKRKKERAPSHVAHVTYDLRHNKSYWVTIEQLARYGGCRAMVDATLDGKEKLVVKTENVRTLSLGPIEEAESVALKIDGQSLGKVDLTEQVMFRQNTRGNWKKGRFDLSGEKRHGVAGGIGDLFFENVLFVIGTTGTEEETHYHRHLAGWADRYYRSHNGGAHRGGIPGTNSVEFEMVDDCDLTDEQRTSNNLLLLGTHKTNAVVAAYEKDLPVKFERNAIRLRGKRYAGEGASVFAIFPHPENAQRYVAVHGGITPDAIMQSAYIHMGLLPDYFVYSGPDNLGWGFWGNTWKAQKPEAK